MLLCDRNIIEFSWNIFGYLQKYSVIFGKCSEKFVWPSNNFWRIGNLRNVFKIVKKVVISIYHLLTESEVITGKSQTQALKPCSLNRENPGRAIETRRDSKNSFFENETIFAFITPRSRSNLTLKIFFIMSGHYKKIMPAQQPIRARVLL